MKRCSKCGIEKNIDEFARCKDRRSGLIARCKECVKKESANWYALNKKRHLECTNKWRAENRARVNQLAVNRRARNPEKAKLADKKWYATHAEQAKINSKNWKSNNREKVKEATLAWRLANPDKVTEMMRRHNIKNVSTVKGKLNHRIRNRINQSLSNTSKARRHWEELVGFTVHQLKKHLESLFRPGMTWENYGTFWHIDHKIPIAAFNFERPEDIDFQICWALKNLQPLEAHANLSKGAKINNPFQPSLAIIAR